MFLFVTGLPVLVHWVCVFSIDSMIPHPPLSHETRRRPSRRIHSLDAAACGTRRRRRARDDAKMKVKTISRIEEDYTRECKSDILKVHRNLDPALHPMHRAKEYKRARSTPRSWTRYSPSPSSARWKVTVTA